MTQQDKWNQRFENATEPGPAAMVVSNNLHLLPARGRSLDLACGIAGNGLLLAQHSLDSCLWDISSVALQRQQNWASERQLPVTVLQRDCEAEPPEVASFDVICVAHFLHRPLCEHLSAALKPGGLLFYQTFCANKLDPIGPSSPEFLLGEGELPRLFPGLHVRFYREDGRCGDLDEGERNRALMVAEKPVAGSIRTS
jgi:SAM-dependent methyltransferase